MTLMLAKLSSDHYSAGLQPVDTSVEDQASATAGPLFRLTSPACGRLERLNITVVAVMTPPRRTDNQRAGGFAGHGRQPGPGRARAQA
jgi:hypothetical protein